MAEPQGPWEQYAAPESQAGPWTAYQPSGDVLPPPVPRDEPLASQAVNPMGDGTGYAPEPIPQAFLDRVAKGAAIDRIMSKAMEGWKEGLGSEPVSGLSPQTNQQLIDIGIFHDPARGGPGPIRLANEAMILPTAKAFETLVRGLNAGLHSAGATLGQINDELNVSSIDPQLTGERLRKEVINAGNWALIESGFGRFSRPSLAADHVIGTLPRAEDFKNAAIVVGGDVEKAAVADARIKKAWQEQGIHPAEIANDAQRDTFLRHQLTAKAINAETPPAFAETMPGAPRALGAEVTTEPPLVSPSVEPLRPPGSLSASMQAGAAKLMDIGKDMQMMLAPMTRGTNESMAIAKDFANTMRRNRWEWSRLDDDIAKRFTPEQRTRMWNAADEESVARQLGERTEHQGLVTLEPAERALVEELHSRAQVAWLRARDLGMVEGEGLPAYTPRMVINASRASAGEGAIPLNGLGMNVTTRTGGMRHREYLTAEETEAAAKELVGKREAMKGKTEAEIRAAVDKVEIARDIRTLPLATAQLEDAIAGRTLIENIKDYGKRTGAETVAEGAIPAGTDAKWFTLDNPAFKTWRPKLSEGGVVKDAQGNIIFEQVPLYVHGDFEGPLRAVLTSRSSSTYQALMELKGKTMSMIMNSPMIHNAVEFGRAFPAMPTRIFKAYFDGNRAKHDVAIMREAIDNGLVPIGKRFFKQDTTGIMEAPDLTPGRSWTSKVLAAVPGLFDEAAGVAVKRAVDKAGDFWHNTLLWDRIADLQMGIYTNMRGDMLAKGVDQQTASRVAAHFANRYAGALPKEAMSDAATKMANMMLFSRTFTLGNLGVMKDMFNGLPKDVTAQIIRDAGTIDPKAVGYAKSMARRKAMMAVTLDIGLLYVGNSVLQSALNVMLGDRTLDEEMHGYAKRFKAVTNEATTHPLSLLQPFSLAEKLSSTDDNEPGKKERLKIGYAKDGTAIYARNPVGKIGEEFVGYLFSPLDMLSKKQGTIARPMLGVISNDKGFGRKIYDPGAETPAAYAKNIWEIVKYFAAAQTPEGQITALSDLVKGDGDAKVNALAAAGPLAGVTFSKGAPGGQAVGEMYHARAQYQYQVDAALPDIRKQIVRGDVAGAQSRMAELGISPALQRFYIRTSQNPATRLSPRAMQDFYRTATPEQIQRMENLRSQPGPLSPDQ